MKKTLLAAVFATFLVSPANAQKAPVGLPIGKWVIYGGVDAMTDKKECIAYYGDKKYIQLTKASFAVGYGGRGGLRGYTLRFDDDPALSMKLPTDVEKQVSAFFIESSDERYARLMAATRLRIQALTLVSGLANEDIDLAGFPDVIARLKGPDCT